MVSRNYAYNFQELVARFIRHHFTQRGQMVFFTLKKSSAGVQGPTSWTDLSWIN